MANSLTTSRLLRLGLMAAAVLSSFTLVSPKQIKALEPELFCSSWSIDRATVTNNGNGTFNAWVNWYGGGFGVGNLQLDISGHSNGGVGGPPSGGRFATNLRYGTTYSATITGFELGGGGSTLSSACGTDGINAPEPPPPPPPPPSCPDPSSVFVVLSPVSVQVGQKSLAIAPDGWSGGVFTSSNNGVASVGTVTGQRTAEINGNSPGTAQISGSGWFANNGASNCSIGGRTLTVTQNYIFNFNANPTAITVCAPETRGTTTVSVTANTYTEVLVYGAAGIIDGTLFMSVPANTEANSTTGKWVRDGTYFKLIAPLDGGKELARITMSVVVQNCAPPPPPGPPPTASIYNTETGKNAGLQVACGKLLAVWQNIADPSSIDGYKIYNESLGSAITVNNPQANRFEFDPRDLDGKPEPTMSYPYSVTSFNGGNESRHISAGSGAAIWPCESNLSSSNKDIVKVRNISLDFDLFQKADSNFTAESLPLTNNTSITFAINIVNSGYEPVTGLISVLDTMHNLARPTSGWQQSVSCNNDCQFRGQPTYDLLNKKLLFVLQPNSGRYLGPGDVWTIYFTAVTSAPSAELEGLYRFRNSATINGFTGPWLSTPYIPVITDEGAPNIYEIQ